MLFTLFYTYRTLLVQHTHDGSHSPSQDWWESLWLNEGFAHFCEYVATNALFPEWKTFEHFTAGTQKGAFSLDSMASTHPVEVPVGDPDEVCVGYVYDDVYMCRGAHRGSS